ncbi:MAG: helix-turn-helix transcriptional regulator [Clostridia bacterium]|nr:helix-turn-helix transcriptional regulator [Clostridia bacterium]
MTDKEKIITYIGERCRYFRHRSGVTVREAADCLGVSSRTIEAYERGEREITTAAAIRLAELYKTTLSKLTNYRNALDDLDIDIYNHDQ